MTLANERLVLEVAAQLALILVSLLLALLCIQFFFAHIIIVASSHNILLAVLASSRVAITSGSMPSRSKIKQYNLLLRMFNAIV